MSSSLQAEPPRELEASIIGYLRSAKGPSVPPPSMPSNNMSVMYNPLSKVAEMPRLARAANPNGTARRLLVAFMIAPVVMFGVLVASWSWSEPQRSRRDPTAAPALPAPSSMPTATSQASSLPTMTLPPPALAGTFALAQAAAAQSDEIELNAMLSTDGAPPDRDVYLDGKSIGKTPLRASVPCGAHTLQMVAGAPKQPIDLPCGGERIVRYDAQGHWSLK
jgi:hypothetical protein